MAKLVVHDELVIEPSKLALLCPFGAIDASSGGVSINAACRMCMICVKKSAGAITLEEDGAQGLEDRTGIAVFTELEGGLIHPVSLELAGKARSLANKLGWPVYAAVIGHGAAKAAAEMLHYGVDQAYAYDSPAFEHFRIEPYTAAFCDFLEKVRPSAVLVGATHVGRNLAPRTAARLNTGLTADCTGLELEADGSLIQTRPAFGGNIMARIKTPSHRPQMATVRYKVMQAPERAIEPSGSVKIVEVTEEMLHSGIKITGSRPKEKVIDLTEADRIIVAGRGVRGPKDMAMIQALADALGAQVATTRPLIEAGWQDPRRQIGLSGRTVKPKLIITCGVSGSVQFVAGMASADRIIAINTDEDAPIFSVAHLEIVGDIYEVVPRLTELIKRRRADAGI